MSKNYISLLMMCLLSMATYAQVTVKMNDLIVNNNFLNDGEAIKIQSGQSVRVQFVVDMSKPENQAINGYIRIYQKRTSSSFAQEVGVGQYVSGFSWGGSGTVYFSASKDITLNASNFNATGGSLYAAFEADVGGATYQSAARSVVVETPADPAITNNSISANQTVGQGNRPAVLSGSTPRGGNGSYAYQWQSSTNNSNWSNVSGATSRNYHPPVLSENRYYRRLVNSGTAARSTSNTVLIKILTCRTGITGKEYFPNPVGPGFTVAYVFSAVVSGGSGNYSLQWQYQEGNQWVTKSTQNVFLIGGIRPAGNYRCVAYDETLGIYAYGPNIENTIGYPARTASSLQTSIIGETATTYCYPNPTSGQLFIKQEADIESITLFDMVDGKQVLTLQALFGNTIKLPDNLIKGNYIIQLNHQDGAVTRERIMVE